jgi:hypothetical protein
MLRTRRAFASWSKARWLSIVCSVVRSELGRLQSGLGGMLEIPLSLLLPVAAKIWLVRPPDRNASARW